MGDGHRIACCSGANAIFAFVDLAKRMKGQTRDRDLERTDEAKTSTNAMQQNKRSGKKDEKREKAGHAFFNVPRLLPGVYGAL